MYRYCALVILFNPQNDVVERIKQYSKNFEKVFVIDNSEKVNEFVKRELIEFGSVDYCHANENKGISITLNIAFKKGIEGGYDFILTMDQDSIFSKKDIECLINYINNNNKNDIGIYAPNFARIYYNKDLKSPTYSKPLYPPDLVHKTYWAITSGSIVKLSAVKQMMPIDENYFIAYVDFELGMQMKLFGYSVLIVGGAILYQHIGGVVNESLLAKKLRFTNYASTRYYYLIRNNFYIRNKYRNDTKFRILTYKKIVKYIFKLATSEKNKILKIKMGYMGYLDYKKGLMGKKNFID